MCAASSLPLPSLKRVAVVYHDGLGPLLALTQDFTSIRASSSSPTLALFAPHNLPRIRLRTSPLLPLPPHRRKYRCGSRQQILILRQKVGVDYDTTGIGYVPRFTTCTYIWMLVESQFHYPGLTTPRTEAYYTYHRFWLIRERFDSAWVLDACLHLDKKHQVANLSIEIVHISSHALRIRCAQGTLCLKNTQ
jgi:hypothetical protein